MWFVCPRSSFFVWRWDVQGCRPLRVRLVDSHRSARTAGMRVSDHSVLWGLGHRTEYRARIPICTGSIRLDLAIAVAYFRGNVRWHLTVRYVPCSTQLVFLRNEVLRAASNTVFKVAHACCSKPLVKPEITRTQLMYSHLASLAEYRLKLRSAMHTPAAATPSTILKSRDSCACSVGMRSGLHGQLAGGLLFSVAWFLGLEASHESKEAHHTFWKIK